VKVYYVCSTGGEAGTVDQRYLRDYDSIEKLRAAEMKCAAEALGLAGVYYLGYRDSGMPGAEENKHPHALMMAPLEEAAGRAVRIIREIRPDVIITHDAGGGYGHPDHIATHHLTVKAFHDAGDPDRYPGDGPAFRPRKLYFAVRPHGTMKLMVKMMPLFGLNPHRFGRNKDIDLTLMMGTEYPVHAVIRLKKPSIQRRSRAVACHASQIESGGRRPLYFRIFGIMDKLMGARDNFMRAYPEPDGRREKDLFEGIP